jgi:hypothetical protein
MKEAPETIDARKDADGYPSRPPLPSHSAPVGPRARRAASQHLLHAPDPEHPQGEPVAREGGPDLHGTRSAMTRKGASGSAPRSPEPSLPSLFWTFA